MTALARSWRLVRRSFWRVLGILLLASIVVSVAAPSCSFPFSLLRRTPVVRAASSGYRKPLGAAVIIGGVGTIVAGTVTRPISAAVTVLLYVDMRIRKEGLDLALRTAAGGGPLADSDFAAAWQPPRPGQPGRHRAARGPAGPACGSAGSADRRGCAAAVVNPARLGLSGLGPGRRAWPAGGRPLVARPARRWPAPNCPRPSTTGTSRWPSGCSTRSTGC